MTFKPECQEDKISEVRIEPLHLPEAKGIWSFMRKRLKRKRRSCTLCKPFKMATELRWKPKELDRIVRAEREIQENSRTMKTDF